MLISIKKQMFLLLIPLLAFKGCPSPDYIPRRESSESNNNKVTSKKTATNNTNLKGVKKSSKNTGLTKNGKAEASDVKLLDGQSAPTNIDTDATKKTEPQPAQKKPNNTPYDEKQPAKGNSPKNGMNGKDTKDKKDETTEPTEQTRLKAKWNQFKNWLTGKTKNSNKDNLYDEIVAGMLKKPIGT